MNIFWKGIFLIAICSFNNLTLIAQTKIKEKKEIAFGLANADTTFRFQKISQYDEFGRLIYKQNYYYHPTQKGILTKEEKSLFDLSNQTLTEYIITYIPNQEPSSQKLVTQYLDYQIKEENSKRKGRQYYDELGELAREDTLTYNTNKDLIQLCTYDYRGNTSLFCDYYTYNKKGLKSKWVTLSKWNTINMKGQVVERHDKRRNYQFRYNKNGQLVQVSGFYYNTRFLQKLTYDENGKIKSNTTLIKRKVRSSNSKTPKKFKIDHEEQILLYENGQLVSDTKLFNKIQTNRTEIEYQDTLVKTLKIKEKNILIDSTGYEYLNSNLLSKKTQTKYTSNGKPRYNLITYYNEKGKAIKEEQIMGNKTLSVLEIQYDDWGNPILQSLTMNNSPVSEKTMYLYIYY